MASASVREDTLITNTHETSGWIKVEATIAAPNCGIGQKELEYFARKQGYLGQRESTYILASQAIKDLSGQYFDEDGTCSRLLGCRVGDSVIGAYFDSDGHLVVFWPVVPERHYRDWGARFEEVKKA